MGFDESIIQRVGGSVIVMTPFGPMLMQSQVTQANALVQQAQSEAARDRENMNAQLQNMQSQVAQAEARAQNAVARAQQNQHRGGGGGVLVMTPFGPMLMH